MQMREAVGRVDDYDARYLPAVLRTFVWALPHQYDVEAQAGARVLVDLEVGGTWLLISEGSASWSLEEGTVGEPDARAEFTSDAAWRWLTGAAVPAEGLYLDGPPELSKPLLGVRGIIV